MNQQIVTSDTYWRPSREQIDELKVGSLVLNCFGQFSPIVQIYACGNDVKGRRYVCFYTNFGNGSTISGSMKEGELVRTTALSRLHTSAQLDVIERTMVDGQICGYYPGK